MALIKCPNCGKEFSEHAEKCPQCGISKEEVARLIAEKEAAEAAERERISKEQKAKEAEEARIRAEKRAEWWAANKKKVGIAVLVIIAVIGILVSIIKFTSLSTNDSKSGNSSHDKYSTDSSEEVTSAQIKDIMSTLSESYDCVFLQGLIDNKYPIHMTIRTNGGRGGEMFGPYLEWLEGAYYYDKVTNGKENHLNLEQFSFDSSNNHLVLVETNSDGKETGTFDGYAKHDVYQGTFIRKKDGKKMPFALKVTQNDGSFILL